MTDYRDPNYRDPARPGGYQEPDLPPADNQSWSAATWGWIAGIAVVVLVLVFAFSGGNSNRTATDTMNPPATTGQRNTVPTPPAGGPATDGPTMNRPAPVPAPAIPPPAPQSPAPSAR